MCAHPFFFVIDEIKKNKSLYAPPAANLPGVASSTGSAVDVTGVASTTDAGGEKKHKHRHKDKDVEAGEDGELPGVASTTGADVGEETKPKHHHRHKDKDAEGGTAVAGTSDNVSVAKVQGLIESIREQELKRSDGKSRNQ